MRQIVSTSWSNEMNPETRALIDNALEERRKAYIKALAKKAMLEHRAGQVEADTMTGKKIDPRDWMVINTAAVKYGAQYGHLLEDKGATVINGKEIPWLGDMQQTDREAVSNIIQNSIQEGKSIPATTKELTEYFGDSKSHAEMVARSEIMNIRNTANADRWVSRGFDRVGIIDDEGPNSCEECMKAMGQVWPMDYFYDHISQHPNCCRHAYPATESDELTDPSEYPEEPV